MHISNTPDPNSTAVRQRTATSMVPKAKLLTDGATTSYYRKSTDDFKCENQSKTEYNTTSLLLQKAKNSDIYLRDMDDNSGMSGFINSTSNSRSISGSESDDFSIQILNPHTHKHKGGFHDLNDDDTIKLLQDDENKRTRSFSSDSNSHQTEKEETSCIITLQITFPFLMAGLGMVCAGLVLDKVQHWEVFQNVSEVFILVPALLGLKGNLEMTLASRLSTVAHLGHLDDPKIKWSIVRGNMILVEAQAMVVALLASLVAMVFGWIPDGKWETNHALILCAGSLLTGAIASGILGAIMILVILLSRKCGINPDNVATPIAASLGDLTTLSLLSGIAQVLYNVLLNPGMVWVVWSIIIFFILLTPILIYLSYQNEFTRPVIKNGWIPILAAMGISSVGGFILDFAVSNNPGIAVFAPVINGVGGNFVAVQASRISSQLHKSEYPLGTLPPTKSWDCVTPCFLYCGQGNLHGRSARVMTMMAIPGQLLFLLSIQFLQAGHTTISFQFVIVYLTVSLIQVVVLLYVCHWLVHRLWRNGEDPDNCAIPYLTALGDLLGTGLLSLGFLFLWTIGDRDLDVGD